MREDLHFESRTLPRSSNLGFPQYEKQLEKFHGNLVWFALIFHPIALDLTDERILINIEFSQNFLSLHQYFLSLAYLFNYSSVLSSIILKST